MILNARQKATMNWIVPVALAFSFSVLTIGCGEDRRDIGFRNGQRVLPQGTVPFQLNGLCGLTNNFQNQHQMCGFLQNDQQFTSADPSCTPQIRRDLFLEICAEFSWQIGGGSWDLGKDHWDQKAYYSYTYCEGLIPHWLGGEGCCTSQSFDSLDALCDGLTDWELNKNKGTGGECAYAARMERYQRQCTGNGNSRGVGVNRFNQTGVNTLDPRFADPRLTDPRFINDSIYLDAGLPYYDPYDPYFSGSAGLSGDPRYDGGNGLRGGPAMGWGQHMGYGPTNLRGVPRVR